MEITDIHNVSVIEGENNGATDSRNNAGEISEKKEYVPAKEVDLVIYTIKTHLYTRQENSKIISITDKNGVDRADPIVEDANIDLISTDALKQFFHKAEVSIAIDRSVLHNEDSSRLHLDVASLNKALATGRLSISRSVEGDSHHIDGLDDFLQTFKKEHAFDDIYNPETEEE